MLDRLVKISPTFNNIKTQSKHMVMV